LLREAGHGHIVENNLGVSKKELQRSTHGDSHVKSAIIFVLDEIDLLVSSRSTESYLRKLFSLAADADATTFVALVCVSNSVDNAKASRLNDLGMGKVAYFGGYSFIKM
jgi:Cdc6-like AAA superfamily ATPase